MQGYLARREHAAHVIIFSATGKYNINSGQEGAEDSVGADPETKRRRARRCCVTANVWADAALEQALATVGRGSAVVMRRRRCRLVRPQIVLGFSRLALCVETRERVRGGS